MLLFKYPLQKRRFDVLFAAVQKEDDAGAMSEAEQTAKAIELLVQTGVIDDLGNLVCEDYTDAEIAEDYERVDYELASMAIEAA